jgi:V8-like Glu-specific endopeptidase
MIDSPGTDQLYESGESGFGQPPDEPQTESEKASPKGKSLRVVGAGNAPVTGARYAFHQGALKEEGTLDADGRAPFGRTDPSRPFLFEVRGRVCAIRGGAYFDPDDPAIEYGGTRFDWTLVRDDKKADKAFWPHYQHEMDVALKEENRATGHRVDRFFQHEHITRRRIRVATPFLSQLSKVEIKALPARIRVGPFVRYTDHTRSVIWVEPVTPTMVRVRYRKAGGGTESVRYASTVRVGGRHFAAVEIEGLNEDEFYEYTLDLAPLPASGSIPVEQADFRDVFPKLSTRVTDSMRAQLSVASFHKNEWLTFRTLRRQYKSTLRFATGSCRWYPGDTKAPRDQKALGPDMFDALGAWLLASPRQQWPQFLFLSGDQIYADEIGDHHGLMLTFGRLAERIPGPADPATSVRDKLVDGAWAGRFAHRYKPFRYPSELVKPLRDGLRKLDDIHTRYPDIKGIYREYPEADPREKLKWRLELLRTRRKDVQKAKAEASDEKKAREAVDLLPVVDRLEISVEPFRAHLPHWEAGFGIAYRGSPMGFRYLSHNFLLWSIPDFEHQLPSLAERDGFTVVRKPDNHGHPSAEGGKHAADFAEYAYLYERSWTSSRNVRVLLAQVPTFLIFDDHELTDDWNFDVSWVRMLHNEKDAFRMWPKTLTDALAAYWVYQGWCNKAPSQWKAQDPRVKALTDAQRKGIDALPALRRCLHAACFSPVPSKNPTASYQTGLSLDWHYRLPFDPPFLVPDCRSRRRMVPGDDRLRVIDHDDRSKTPLSQTIDDGQLAWMRKILVDEWRGGPVAFLAPSTPLLMQKKVMGFMRLPEVAARAWAQGADLVAISAALFDSPKLGSGSDELLRVFRRAKDLEHMIRDKSWRDLWELVEAMRKKGSPVKTLVLVSGDVHHSYSMTANPSGSGRPRPELVQVTSSGFQTTIRKEFKTSLAEQLGSFAFNLGKHHLVPGFVRQSDTGTPDLALFENTAAIIDVGIGAEVSVVVTYLAGQNRHLFRYTSASSYMTQGMPTVLADYLRSRPRSRFEIEQETEVQAKIVPQISHTPLRRDGVHDSGLESPFLGETLFTGESDDFEAQTGPILSESPFGAPHLLQSVLEATGSDLEGPATESTESRFLEEEQSGADTALPGETSRDEFESGAHESGAHEESESAEPSLEDGSEPGLELQVGGIAGVDDRTEVRDTTMRPYRWVCSIAYEAGGQTLQGGTGCLISNRHVLTAGHVIRNKAAAPGAHAVFVYPGRHFAGQPFGRIPVVRARVSASNFDFGLITLEHPVDPAVQWWGQASSQSAWWSEALIPLRELVNPGIPLSTAGYPSAKDRQRRRMFESNGATVAGRFAGIFRHTLDTTEGQSGSPIWTLRNGLYVLIGIATSYGTTGQLASWVRFVQAEVNRWMSEDAPRPPRQSERRIALEIPYRWVCRLEVRDNDLKRVVAYGTGLLISDRHVLTSASVIHGFSKDRRRYSVRVASGYELGKEPLGSTTGSAARVSPGFSPGGQDASADYALLTLSRSVGRTTFASIGNVALGYWGGDSHRLVTSAADWSGKSARIAAFSRSSGGGGGYHKLRAASGGIAGLQRGQILQEASSKLDAPGAPIWVETGKTRVLVGIASAMFSKDSSVNWGCYLSQEVLSHLMKWVNEDYERHELEAGSQFNQDELESFLASPETDGSTGETSSEPEPQTTQSDAESDAGRFNEESDTDAMTIVSGATGDRWK